MVNRDFDTGKIAVVLALSAFIGSFIYFSIPFDQTEISPKVAGCFASTELGSGTQFQIETGIMKFDDKIVRVEAGQDKGGYYLVPKHGILLEKNGNFSVNSQGILKLRLGPEGKYLEIPEAGGGFARLARMPCA